MDIGLKTRKIVALHANFNKIFVGASCKIFKFYAFFVSEWAKSTKEGGNSFKNVKIFVAPHAWMII